MAKKTRTSSRSKASGKKAPARKKAASSTARKSAARSKKKTAKKPASRKAAPKAASRTKAPAKKKAVTKASTRKKVAPKKKSPAKKAAKAAPKKTAPKKVAKKATPKQAPAKKAPAKSAAKPTSTAKKATEQTTPADDKKPARKGITIVSDRPKKKASPKAPTSKFPPTGSRLLGPGSPVRKPLIPSGPSRAAEVARERAATEHSGKKPKSPFNKRELDRFRQILLTKRAELFGDMSTMETGALRSESGGLSHTPQHFAEQGSDSYDQSLSLDLAAADRRLIVEIDAALQRIADKTFGVCELTGKPITKARLEELPWARYSIEAARELERRSGFRP